MTARRRPFRSMRKLARSCETFARLASSPDSEFVTQWRACASTDAFAAESLARAFYRSREVSQTDAFPDARELFP